MYQRHGFVANGGHVHWAADAADAYLTKPVRPEELTSCLASLLERPA